jgi:hypothetical protein
MTPKEVSLLLWELHLFPFWHHDSQLRFAGPHRDRACWLIPFPLLSSSKLNLQALRYGSGCTNRSSRTIHHRLCQPISARARNVWAPLNTRLALSRTGTIRLRLVQQNDFPTTKRSAHGTRLFEWIRTERLQTTGGKDLRTHIFKGTWEPKRLYVRVTE